MASGVKQNETRSWPTSYRGNLVICASKRKPSLEECGDVATYAAAMAMPYGAALCVVELYDCVARPWRLHPRQVRVADAEPSGSVEARAGARATGHLEFGAGRGSGGCCGLGW